MIGLLLLGLRDYVAATFGPTRWHDILDRAGCALRGLEPLQFQDHGGFLRVVGAAAQVLDRAPDLLLEDMGTHIVAGRADSAARRLLRFGGDDFTAFLLSLEELPDRARLALPGLHLPRLVVTQQGSASFHIGGRSPLPQLSPVLVGVLRAMADDYGALVVIDRDGPHANPHANSRSNLRAGRRGGRIGLTLRLLEARFAAGKHFALAPAAHATGLYGGLHPGQGA